MENNVIFKILSNVSVDKESGCWNWNKSKNQKGYGHIKVKEKGLKPHRIVFAEFNGEIKEGYVIDHICKNRACCNPDHLRQVTLKENTLENSNSLQAINAKKTHCIRGHAFSVENTYINNSKEGIKRQCIRCVTERNKYKSASSLSIP